MKPIEIIVIVASVLIVGGVIALSIVRKLKGKTCCDCGGNCSSCCDCSKKEKIKKNS